MTSQTIIRWGAVAGAVVALSAGITLFKTVVGEPPFANAGNLEEVQRKVIILNIDLLNLAYDRLLARRDAYLVAGKPVPIDLQQRIRNKCREIKAGGGGC